MQRLATCSCGQLTVGCDGDPALVSVCHCIACQKRTGAPFGIAAFYRREDTTVSGAWRTFERPSDSGFAVRFHFCGDCGSTVFWEPLRKPDYLGVAVGAFGDPGFPAPGQEVHTGCRHGWVAPLGTGAAD